ncbi:hypothetical protein PpBr36_02898 [Pyricularia pennisetigena]|uniref:hypothetical protein n=1 Tax=Pyricularia pennisetigena TaxID=1578925 RepID=UPI00114ECEC0|nr:hypothetical protein PpBr36_02898 [Pyricularia pennisetigena]TLS31256.1 hypothetical protein PpBr36_02898 [Pyricularia pennisetigena]
MVADCKTDGSSAMDALLLELFDATGGMKPATLADRCRRSKLCAQAGPRPVHVLVFWKVNLVHKVGIVKLVVVKVDEARGGPSPPAKPATEAAFHHGGVADGLADPVDYMCMLDGPVAGTAGAPGAATAAAVATAGGAPAVAGGHGAGALRTAAACL